MDYVVEDGTGLANATIYMSADNIRAYALDRGVVLPAVSGTDPISAWMVLAMDYLAAQRYIYTPATTTQALDWPRKPYCDAGSNDWLMPKQIQLAMAQLVVEQFNGIKLFASTPGFAQGGAFITREKVDVIETSYSERVVPPDAPSMPAVQVLLRDLVISSSILRAVRA